MKIKYLIFSISNEWESMVAIIEWDGSMLERVKRRIALANKIAEEDGGLSSIAFVSDSELFEYGPKFQEWLESHGMEEDWEDSSIICDERPQFDDPIRIDVVRLSISEYGFWWKIRPKHSDNDLESPYFSMKDSKTKRLLEAS